MVDLLLLISLCYLFADPIFDNEAHKHLDESLVTAISSGFYTSLYLFLPWLSLIISVFIFSLSGIPGKKCGSILFTVEELSNCRVSLKQFSYVVLNRLIHMYTQM